MAVRRVRSTATPKKTRVPQRSAKAPRPTPARPASRRGSSDMDVKSIIARSLMRSLRG